MSTSSQIQSVRATEQRYPVDLIRNGRTYRHGYRIESDAIRTLREYRKKVRIDRSKAPLLVAGM